jgi:hypothetical protein
LIEAESSV